MTPLVRGEQYGFFREEGGSMALHFRGILSLVQLSLEHSNLEQEVPTYKHYSGILILLPLY